AATGQPPDADFRLPLVLVGCVLELVAASLNVFAKAGHSVAGAEHEQRGEGEHQQTGHGVPPDFGCELQPSGAIDVPTIRGLLGLPCSVAGTIAAPSAEWAAMSVRHRPGVLMPQNRKRKQEPDEREIERARDAEAPSKRETQEDAEASRQDRPGTSLPAQRQRWEDEGGSPPGVISSTDATTPEKSED